MPGRLEDKVAIVTGAGRGIGRATAALLAGEGADVACVARTGPELAEAAAGVRAAGRRAIQIQADIGDPDAAGLIAARVQAVLGDVDIVVNNAATVTPVGPTASIDPDQWARALAVNVAGKTWSAPEVLAPFPGRQFQIALPSRSQALQLYRLLVPPG